MAKFKCSDGIYTVLRNGKVVAGGATAGEAIVAISTDAAECNNPVYTVLRNGKVITMSGTSATAIANIAADAVNVVCPPECCITEVPITIDSFDIVVTTAEYTGLSIRATITHGVDTYSTSWVAAAATNTIDLTGLIVEFTAFTDGDTICIEYSYDETNTIQGCCLTVQTNTYLEDDTYQLSEIVTECEGGVFDLVFENPPGGVTVDADGEMVVPDIEADETVYVAYTCDGCVTELLILTATNVVPVEGLRMLFNSIGNVPVVDASNVGQWNTFFNLPTNGAVFTSVSVTGNEVILVGGGAMTIKNSAFVANTNLIEIEDQTGIVVAAGVSSFNTCSNLTTLLFPEMLTTGDFCFKSSSSITTYDLAKLATAGEDCFIGWTVASLTLAALITGNTGCFGSSTCTTYSMLLATTLENKVFNQCLSATLIDIPLCVNLGVGPTDASVFNNIVGSIITLNVAAVNATNNAGGVHASVAYLIANNTATVNYI